jgi:hypothetical protein
MSIEERLAAHGLALPPGHTLVALDEQPELQGPMGGLNVAAWPEFMLHDGVVEAHWHHLFEAFSDTRCCLPVRAALRPRRVRQRPLGLPGRRPRTVAHRRTSHTPVHPATAMGQVLRSRSRCPGESRSSRPAA